MKITPKPQIVMGNSPKNGIFLIQLEPPKKVPKIVNFKGQLEIIGWPEPVQLEPLSGRVASELAVAPSPRSLRSLVPQFWLISIYVRIKIVSEIILTP